MNEMTRAKRLAMRFLSVRMYTSREIYDRLRRKGYGDEVAETIVSQLIEEGILDDRNYADCYIADSVNLNLKGMYRIRQELLRKGVPPAVVERALSESEADFESALRELVERKLLTMEITDRKDYEKFKEMLARRGYSSGEINSVLDEYNFELNSD